MRKKGNVIIITAGKLYKLQIIHHLNGHWLDNERK